MTNRAPAQREPSPKLLATAYAALTRANLEAARLVVLVVGDVLAACSLLAVGVVGFVGLIAPHAARALVGP